MLQGYDHLRTWQEGDFRLEVFTAWQVDNWGKIVVGYQFYHNDKMIFEGEDFHCSRMDKPDSDQVVSGLLAFLSLQPGDVDPAYFKAYTKDQWDWMEAHAEELANLGG